MYLIMINIQVQIILTLVANKLFKVYNNNYNKMMILVLVVYFVRDSIVIKKNQIEEAKDFQLLVKYRK